MNSDGLTSASSNRRVWKRSKADISPDFITKPSTLADECPIENQSKRFPAIEGTNRKIKPQKKSVSTSDSLEFWLKPGISLPKLHSKKVLQERVEAGEPFTCFSYSNLPKKKLELELDDSSSADPVKCFLTKREPFEVPCGASDSSEFLFKVPSAELNLDKLQAEEETLEEDNALKNWRKWTQRHKAQQKYLSERLKRRPFNLLIQKSNLFRQRLEDKILLATWDIPQADKWRGHPYQWIMPVELGEIKGSPVKFHERDSSPAYFLQKTLTEKGIVRDLEFIGISAAIRKEKGLESPKVPHEFIKSNQKIDDAAIMVEERIQSFLKFRSRMRPPSANFSELAVIGSKIAETVKEEVPDPPVITDVPQIEVTGPDNETSCQDTRQSVFCLVINGIEIQYSLGQAAPQNDSKGSFDYTWELDFGINEEGNRLEKTLQIENKGTMAVKYKWISKKLEQSQKLNKLLPKDHEPWFFFNKNSGIFLPGEFYNLKFYCHVQKAGVRTETWYLETTPPLRKDTGRGTIVLSAVASGGCTNLKSRVIEAYLRERSRDSIVKFILDVVLEKATSSPGNLRGLEYKSFFSEKELFEYHNPKYYYHSEVVGELSKLFKKVPSKIQNSWDLSLDSLKKLISISAKGKDRELLLCELYKMAKPLLKPNRVFFREEKKYRMAYNILCKMTNFMEADYDYLRNILSGRKREFGDRSRWQYYEYEETVNSVSLMSEEKCDLDASSEGSMYEIKPINLIYFQTMFYIKVYHRVGNAVENIASMLETSKNVESSKNIDYDLSKPPRPNKGLDFFPCLQIF